MRGKTRLKSIVIPVFLAVMVLSAAMSNQALGITYKAIDLHPSGFSTSYAYGTSGAQQVGYGPTGGYNHALLWNGSAAGYVDLNPSGFVWSVAYGANGTQQVGDGSSGVGGHALLWNGSEDNYIDLNQFLPTSFISARALSIDDYGNIVGFAVDELDNCHAILWQPIPEPATLLLLGLGAVMLKRKR